MFDNIIDLGPNFSKRSVRIGDGDDQRNVRRLTSQSRFVVPGTDINEGADFRGGCRPRFGPSRCHPGRSSGQNWTGAPVADIVSPSEQRRMGFDIQTGGQDHCAAHPGNRSSHQAKRRPANRYRTDQASNGE
jgi:hypothetical protein